MIGNRGHGDQNMAAYFPIYHDLRSVDRAYDNDRHACSSGSSSKSTSRFETLLSLSFPPALVPWSYHIIATRRQT